MSVDIYANCPCGSGKKIKFCKCKDSVGDLDRVLKMVEGGQIVPALDRLSGVLQEHPDAAWALAIRGRLLLDLREYESLAENADRFIRLQPSNPLALTQRAAAHLFRGDIDAATAAMLEALTESGQDVDAFVLDVASVLAYSLAQGGVFLTARVYATLAMMASGYEGGRTAMQVLRQLNSAPTISQLLKSVPEPLERPADAEWGERYDEASGLLRSNKVVLAQSKFESLNRSVPGEPAVLSGLLTCAIWRGDTETQSEMLKKLSACESLDFEQRARYRAMAALVPPTTPELTVEVGEFAADIENPEEVEMAMSADSRFVALPSDMLSGLKANEDDIPPRGGFQILDRDKPDTSSLPPVDQLPEAIGMVLVYGKQTDRPARLQVHDVRMQHVEEVRSRIVAAVGEIDLKQQPGEPLPLLVAAQPAVAMIRFQAGPAEAEALQAELTEQRTPEAITSAPLPLLGGASLVELADDAEKLLERTAAMRVIEHYDQIASHGERVLERIYELAKLEPLPALHPSDGELESLPNEDLNRIDPSELDTESLIYLLQRAQQVSATPTVRRVAGRLIEADLTGEQKPAKLLAYMSLINAAGRSDRALELLAEAKQYAEANEMPISNLLLSEVGVRLRAGDGQGFQKTIETLTSRYSNDPEVMAQLQQILMAHGLIRPDGSPRSAPPAEGAAGPGAPAAAAPASAGGSGIWTPDSGAPAAAAPQKPAEKGGSKLWVPGMD